MIAALLGGALLLGCGLLTVGVSRMIRVADEREAQPPYAGRHRRFDMFAELDLTDDGADRASADMHRHTRQALAAVDEIPPAALARIQSAVDVELASRRTTTKPRRWLDYDPETITDSDAWLEAVVEGYFVTQLSDVEWAWGRDGEINDGFRTREGATSAAVGEWRDAHKDDFCPRCGASASCPDCVGA